MGSAHPLTCFKKTPLGKSKGGFFYCLNRMSNTVRFYRKVSQGIFSDNIIIWCMVFPISAPDQERRFIAEADCPVDASADLRWPGNEWRGVSWLPRPAEAGQLLIFDWQFMQQFFEGANYFWCIGSAHIIRAEYVVLLRWLKTHRSAGSLI